MDGREKSRQLLCMSFNSVKEVNFSQSKFLHIPFLQYFDNHTRNDNLSESSFFWPFKGNSYDISEKELPWIVEIRDIRA